VSEQPAVAEVRDLYRKYGRIVHAAAHRVLRHDDLAEEATVDTFVRAARDGHRRAADGAEHRWLVAIATRSITEISWRERHRSTAREALDRETIDAVWKVRRVIDLLPSADATVLRLLHRDGLTSGQIAAQLGVTVTAVSATSDRARRQLAGAWEALRERTDGAARTVALPSRPSDAAAPCR
jgi:RNA polymerase sigma factor (sigma-70 family)